MNSSQPSFMELPQNITNREYNLNGFIENMNIQLDDLAGTTNVDPRMAIHIESVKLTQPILNLIDKAERKGIRLNIPSAMRFDNEAEVRADGASGSDVECLAVTSGEIDGISRAETGQGARVTADRVPGEIGLCHQAGTIDERTNKKSRTAMNTMPVPAPSDVVSNEEVSEKSVAPRATLPARPIQVIDIDAPGPSSVPAPAQNSMPSTSHGGSTVLNDIAFVGTIQPTPAASSASIEEAKVFKLYMNNVFGVLKSETFLSNSSEIPLYLFAILMRLNTLSVDGRNMLQPHLCSELLQLIVSLTQQTDLSSRPSPSESTSVAVQTDPEVIVMETTEPTVSRTSENPCANSYPSLPSTPPTSTSCEQAPGARNSAPDFPQPSAETPGPSTSIQPSVSSQKEENKGLRLKPFEEGELARIWEELGLGSGSLKGDFVSAVEAKGASWTVDLRIMESMKGHRVLKNELEEINRWKDNEEGILREEQNHVDSKEKMNAELAANMRLFMDNIEQEEDFGSESMANSLEVMTRNAKQFKKNKKEIKKIVDSLNERKEKLTARETEMRRVQLECCRLETRIEQLISLGEQYDSQKKTILKMYLTEENSAEKKALKSKIHSIAGELPIDPEIFTMTAELIRRLSLRITLPFSKKELQKTLKENEEHSSSTSSSATTEDTHTSAVEVSPVPKKRGRPRKNQETQDVASILPPKMPRMATKTYEESEE